MCSAQDRAAAGREVADLRNVLKAELIGFTAKPEVGVREKEDGADARV